VISRRHFMRLAGLSGIAVRFHGLPGSARRAFAHTDTPVRRLIVVSHCHGWPYETWKLRADGLPDDQPWTLDLATLAERDFSAALAPLYPHRRRLLALDGLSLATAELDADGNRHDRGWVHAWTGNVADFSGTDTRTTSMSLDQLVAGHVARPDRLRSLELSVDAALEAGRPIAYGPSGIRLPAENTPMRAWERVFGPAAGETPGAGPRAALDYAYREYRELAPGLGAGERARLDTHFGLLRSLGARLDGLAAIACEIPARPSASFDLYDRRFDAFAEIIAAALACDITRVVTLSLGEMPTAEFGADHVSDKVHKGIAHYIYDDPAKYRAMTGYLVHHSRQVARLVATLEAIPDAGGGSLMDNTLIVWGSELGDGWHGYRHYCPVLIGGSWAFKGGRYLYWPHRTPIELLVPAMVSVGGRTRFSGLPHQKLLVSVARAMGLDVDHVGLEHVRGQRGDFIAVNGPLEGLTG
jgi:hypothetical protein